MKPLKSIFNHTMYTMFILLGMTSCRWFETEEKPKHDRTVLVYMAADNNLSYTYSDTVPSFARQDIAEMVSAARDIAGNSRLLVYIDDADLPRILSIEQQKGRRPVARTVHQYTSEHNSGDAETLRSALEWTVENYTAESYGLVLWSHGNAWLPAKAPAQRAICQDNNPGSWMEIKDIANVLAPLPHLDFIMLDACFMQSIEVAYELRHTTDYIISSPAEIPGPGAPYNRLAAPFTHTPFNPEEIIEQYYREYQDRKIQVTGHAPACFGVCLSVIDCRQLDHLASATSDMLGKYASNTHSTTPTGVQRYYPLNSSTMPEYYDMNGYMRRLITEADDYAYWKSAFDHAVPHRRTTPQWFSDYTGCLEDIIDPENYGGISCYVPKDGRTKLNQAFRSTAWYQAAGWQQAGW